MIEGVDKRYMSWLRELQKPNPGSTFEEILDKILKDIQEENGTVDQLRAALHMCSYHFRIEKSDKNGEIYYILFVSKYPAKADISRLREYLTTIDNTTENIAMARQSLEILQKAEGNYQKIIAMFEGKDNGYIRREFRTQ